MMGPATRQDPWALGLGLPAAKQLRLRHRPAVPVESNHPLARRDLFVPENALHMRAVRIPPVAAFPSELWSIGRLESIRGLTQQALYLCLRIPVLHVRISSDDASFSHVRFDDRQGSGRRHANSDHGAQNEGKPGSADANAGERGCLVIVRRLFDECARNLLIEYPNGSFRELDIFVHRRHAKIDQRPRTEHQYPKGGTAGFDIGCADDASYPQQS